MKKLTTTKYDFLYTGLNFNNKTFYAGREIGDDMIGASGHLFYFSHTGIYAGASGVCYDQMYPQYNSTTLSLGYSHAIGKKKYFYAKGSYSRFIHNQQDTSSYYPYENNANIGLSFRKKWFGARVSGNVLFGDETVINFSPSIYSNFYFLKFGTQNKMYFTPEVSAYFSKDTILVNTGTESSFGLMNTQIYLPLGIYLGNFDIQLSYAINFPYNQDDNQDYPISSYFGLSVSYMLPIARKEHF